MFDAHLNLISAYKSFYAPVLRITKQRKELFILKYVDHRGQPEQKKRSLTKMSSRMDDAFYKSIPKVRF